MSAPLLSPCCGVEVKLDRYYLPDEWYVCRACSWRFAIGRLLEERAARSVAPVRGFQDARTSLQMAVEEDALARARGPSAGVDKCLGPRYTSVSIPSPRGGA